VIEKSYLEARRLNHRELRPEHLLLALASVQTTGSHMLRRHGLSPDKLETAMVHDVDLHTDGRPVTRSDAEALRSIGIDIDQVRDKLEENFGTKSLLPSTFVPNKRREHLRFSIDAKRALAEALCEAKLGRANHIEATHILLGLLSNAHGPAAQLMNELGVDPERLRGDVLIATERSQPRSSDQP
jgi:ATP-dependent Clp protease ATP-binding subunit ClpA